MHIGEFISGVSLRMIGVMIYCAITKGPPVFFSHMCGKFFSHLCVKWESVKAHWADEVDVSCLGDVSDHILDLC